jgi:hypothetical protein
VIFSKNGPLSKKKIGKDVRRRQPPPKKITNWVGPLFEVWRFPMKKRRQVEHRVQGLRSAIANFEAETAREGA